VDAKPPVKSIKAGSKLIISGPDPERVLAALKDLELRGAKVLSKPEQVGSNWIATCDDPDDRSDQITVTRIGLQIIIRGPTAALVQDRVKELVHSGAKLLAPVKASGSEFIAICDEGGIDNLIHRW
jgi:hypothetical protein